LMNVRYGKGPRPGSTLLDRRQFGVGAAIALFAASQTAAAPMAFAADNSIYSQEIKKIKDRGQLIVGLTNFDSPPFYYQRRKDSSEQSPSILDGFDIQLANEIAQSLEVELVLNRQSVGFNQVVDLLLTNDIDIAISKLSITIKRAMRVAFTHPTIELRHALLANRIAMARSSMGHNLSTVINHGFSGSIGVIASSSFADTAKQLFPRATLDELKTWDEVVDAVDAGAVDIAYRDELEIKRIMRLRPELHLNVRSVLISDKKDAIGIALPWQSTQFASLVNVILSKRRRFDANQLLDEYQDIFTAKQS